MSKRPSRTAEQMKRRPEVDCPIKSLFRHYCTWIMDGDFSISSRVLVPFLTVAPPPGLARSHIPGLVATVSAWGARAVSEPAYKPSRGNRREKDLNGKQIIWLVATWNNLSFAPTSLPLLTHSRRFATRKNARSHHLSCIRLGPHSLKSSNARLGTGNAPQPHIRS